MRLDEFAPFFIWKSKSFTALSICASVKLSPSLRLFVSADSSKKSSSVIRILLVACDKIRPMVVFPEHGGPISNIIILSECRVYRIWKRGQSWPIDAKLINESRTVRSPMRLGFLCCLMTYKPMPSHPNPPIRCRSGTRSIRSRSPKVDCPPTAFRAQIDPLRNGCVLA